MSEKIKQLASKCYKTGPLGRDGWPEYTSFDQEQFAELIKQAIYDQVKREIVDDDLIDAQLDIEDRCYLRGNNGGIVDALCIIKNFGVEE